MVKSIRNSFFTIIFIVAITIPGLSWTGETTNFLRDRGKGVPLSMFATYIEKQDLIVYAFYEYTYNSSEEYKPQEFGYVGEKDYLGTSKSHETLLFFSYGMTNDIAVEFETAFYTSQSFKKDSNDTSNMPNKIEESGLGDIEGQIRWRWQNETLDKPDLFSYFELVYPGVTLILSIFFQTSRHFFGSSIGLR